ncbi:hypothetical protein ACF1BU_02795 [Streptomyces sp. NPDC014724]|uniref:hypothetical protein n=1 Tax=unclassified Streptomyces TaxID=2593676 RepID=UPI0036FED504
MPIKLKEWAAISRPEYRRMARDTRFDLAFRVHFAALGKVNQLGHAELTSGELAAILTRMDGQPQPKQGVSRAIKSAKDLGLVGPSWWDLASKHVMHLSKKRIPEDIAIQPLTEAEERQMAADCREVYESFMAQYSGAH